MTDRRIQDPTLGPRLCTCYPGEAPVPCQHKYAFSDCLKAQKAAYQSAFNYLGHLLDVLYPGIELTPTLMERCTQVDSCIVGVREKEREACAQLMEGFPEQILSFWERPGSPPGNGWVRTTNAQRAAAIRTRGEPNG